MGEWLVETGIGEDRAILFDRGHVLAARLHWPGSATAGQVADARLVDRVSGASRGIGALDSGERVLLSGLPRAASEGGMIRVAITRAAIGEAGRAKLAHGRISDATLRAAPSLLEQLTQNDRPVREVHRFPEEADWTNLCEEARAGRIAFAGGSLVFSSTPAMLLIDIDGYGSPEKLGLAAVEPIASALRCFDCSGSIGIDFPTPSTRAARKAIDEALGKALRDWQHERVAMNGFGFVHLVSRLERPSILARLTFDPAGASARALLRQAEGLRGPGALLLTCPPSVEARLRPEWLDTLRRRSGRSVRIRSDAALDLCGGHAQLVTI